MQIAMKISLKSGMGAFASRVFALLALAFVMAAPAVAFTAYVSNEKGNSISIIDTDKLEVTKTVPVGHRPRGIALNKDGSELYICAGDDDQFKFSIPGSLRSLALCHRGQIPSF